MLRNGKRVPNGTYLYFQKDIIKIGGFSKELSCYFVSAITRGIRSGPCSEVIIERIYQEEMTLLKHMYLNWKYK
jgi:hypothetical protein